MMISEPNHSRHSLTSHKLNKRVLSKRPVIGEMEDISANFYGWNCINVLLLAYVEILQFMRLQREFYLKILVIIHILQDKVDHVTANASILIRVLEACLRLGIYLMCFLGKKTNPECDKDHNKR